MAEKVFAGNRKAFHDYHVIEKIEAGLALTGTEVKSVRAGQISLREAFARIDHGEAWLYGAHIAPYSHGNRYNAEPTRPRKLLLHRREVFATRDEHYVEPRLEEPRADRAADSPRSVDDVPHRPCLPAYGRILFLVAVERMIEVSSPAIRGSA